MARPRKFRHLIPLPLDNIFLSGFLSLPLAFNIQDFLSELLEAEGLLNSKTVPYPRRRTHVFKIRFEITSCVSTGELIASLQHLFKQQQG